MNTMNNAQRKAYREKAAGMQRDNKRVEYDRIMTEIDREMRFGAPAFPKHARTLRTASGVRFGW